MNPATTAGLAFNFDQPLLRGFGLAVNNRYIRIAKNNRNVSDLVFEQQVVSTAYAVARLYWDLVALRSNVSVQRESVDLADRLLRENVQQEQIGTLAPIEVVRTRAQLASARRDLTVAETRLRQQETVLKDYLTRGTVDSQSLSSLCIIPTDSIVTPTQIPSNHCRTWLPRLARSGPKRRNPICKSRMRDHCDGLAQRAASSAGSGCKRTKQCIVRVRQPCSSAHYDGYHHESAAST